MKTTTTFAMTAALVCLSCGFVLAGSGGGTFPATFDSSTLDGLNGFRLNGVDAGDYSGGSVSIAGDVNGDGVDDLLISTMFAEVPDGRSNVGEIYCVFGSKKRIRPSLELSALDGTQGFVMVGVRSGDYCGSSVAGAGDVNGDGIGDIVIGASAAPATMNPGSGRIYVVYGRTDGFRPRLELNSLDGTEGFTLNGVPSDFAGASVSGVGDVNADGIDDLLIGAPQLFPPLSGRRAGKAYVVFGRSEGFPATVDLSSLNGTDGFVMYGIDDEDRAGFATGRAGDVNGDGIADMVIGAYHLSASGSNAGEAYLVFGRDVAFPAELELSSLDGTNGQRLVTNGHSVGNSVSDAGDVNGDGIDDLLIASEEDRKAYVVYGTTSGHAPLFELGSLDGTNGFAMTAGELVWIARSVSAAGDMNEDGIDDVLIGSPGWSSSGAGFVLFGREDGFPPLVELSTLDGTDGFEFDGLLHSSLGWSVSGSGDLNGDGIDDVLLGARNASPNGETSAGQSYVLFGRANCAAGRVNAANGFVHDAVFVDGSTGGNDRTVQLGSDQFVTVTVLKPITGGSGKFVLHADTGNLGSAVSLPLPLNAGFTCNPFLLPRGASPVIVANNIGRPDIVGESMFFGVPIADPDRATTTIFYPPLPAGTVLTFQGVIVDPGAFSIRGVSSTNAVTLEIIPSGI